MPSMPPVKDNPKNKRRSQYNSATGNGDLYTGDLSGRMWRLLLIGGIVLALLIGLGIGSWIGPGRQNKTNGDRTEPPITTSPNGNISTTPSKTALETPILTPALLGTLATVTALPPTASETPTPGPCYQTAQQGDTILGMAIRCGHKDMIVIDLILEINNMESPTQLQLGQTLEIPWPTPTPGGEPVESREQATGSSSDTGDNSVTEVQYNEFGTPDALAAYQNVEPTLRPGQAWHVVQAGETIIEIAYHYDTSVEVLSQINPEIPFMQCDYGLTYGGPNCAVMLSEGQRVRVPVPLPTLTPTPTPAGTLTPKPTMTPIFNAPYPLGPKNNTHFLANQIITLRWGGTDTLAPDERYVVHVQDLDNGEQYVDAIAETAYILSGEWQPDDGQRHTFEWTISIGRVDDQANILSEVHATEAQQFTWDSR